MRESVGRRSSRGNVGEKRTEGKTPKIGQPIAWKKGGVTIL